MSRQGGGGRGGKQMPREVVLSKALSHLLRHSADRENLKISKEGYVNVADLLETRKIKPLKATLAEILESVSSSDKQRFSLLYVPATTPETENDSHETQADEKEEREKEKEGQQIAFATAASEEKQKTATAHALSVRDSDASHFLIRATQGHSMKCVDTTLFLEKLSLDGDDSIPEKSATAKALPDTVVHGTYHGAWPLILASGGLQAMNRAQVHFAVGPTVDEIFPNGRDAPPAKLPTGKQNQNVISGMRSDAEILIYINLQKALQAGCPFYRSENGVILSEGMVSPDADHTAGKSVPVEFFDLVVERKAGLGVLWEDGKLVQELPENLAAKKNPKSFRGGRGRGRGRGGHS
ncbi:tRNA splicing 2' phosphotransferase 1 [Talaromyces islandicus]|uniref:2'-phosphotransferase n=1 Tax=Talaromyces islandicus TaxID=28573 RepID=A0A0U1LQS2_TALIS|nr:tRNA splicing 2' phosphotransferase 1 [Talaromyces islandicus]